MSKVILYIAASLDGYIAREDGDVSWLEPIEAGGEDYGYSELLDRVGTAIMGGSTYRQVLGFGEWPYSSLHTVVITRQSLPTPPGSRVDLVSGDIKQLVAEIRAESERDIWLIGGAQIIRLFHEAQLIDETILSIMPVLIGAGIPLFSPTAAPDRALKLLHAESYPSGVVQLRYKHR